MKLETIWNNAFFQIVFEPSSPEAASNCLPFPWLPSILGRQRRRRRNFAGWVVLEANPMEEDHLFMIFMRPKEVMKALRILDVFWIFLGLDTSEVIGLNIMNLPPNQSLRRHVSSIFFITISYFICSKLHLPSHSALQTRTKGLLSYKTDWICMENCKTHSRIPQS